MNGADSRRTSNDARCVFYKELSVSTLFSKHTAKIDRGDSGPSNSITDVVGVRVG